MWTWKQSRGELLYEGRTVACGYSGYGAGRNNPRWEDRVGLGPIPRGHWTMTEQRDSRNTGPLTITLVPEQGTTTFGRSEFRIHGDSISRPGTASHGCIILPRAIRRDIWASGDRRLIVIG